MIQSFIKKHYIHILIGLFILSIVITIILVLKRNKNTNQINNQLSSLSFPSFLSSNQIKTILSLTSIFENSTPDLQFGYAENIGDGRGITLGFSGFTSGTSDALMVFEEYNKLSGGSDAECLKYLGALRAIDKKRGDAEMIDDTTGLEGFIKYVNSLGNNELFIKSQLKIANDLYVIPSQTKATNMGFKLPITYGEFYDAYINHGEDGALAIIKQTGMFNNNNETEINWLSRFLNNRYKVLQKYWPDAVDRVTVYKKLLDNPNLNLPITVNCYNDTFILN